jgi:hypothetical protein
VERKYCIGKGELFGVFGAFFGNTFYWILAIGNK